MSVIGSVGRFVGKVGKTVGKVVNNPVVRVSAIGIATAVCPAAGPKVAEGMQVASKLSAAAASLDPKKKQAAAKILKNTAQLAQRGDKDARRMLTLVKTTQAAQRGDKVAVAKIKALAKVVTAKKPIVVKRNPKVTAVSAVKPVQGKKLPTGTVVARFELLSGGRMRKVG